MKATRRSATRSAWPSRRTAPPICWCWARRKSRLATSACATARATRPPWTWMRFWPKSRPRSPTAPTTCKPTRGRTPNKRRIPPPVEPFGGRERPPYNTAINGWQSGTGGFPAQHKAGCPAACLFLSPCHRMVLTSAAACAMLCRYTKRTNSLPPGRGMRNASVCASLGLGRCTHGCIFLQKRGWL